MIEGGREKENEEAQEEEEEGWWWWGGGGRRASTRVTQVKIIISHRTQLVIDKYFPISPVHTNNADSTKSGPGYVTRVFPFEGQPLYDQLAMPSTYSVFDRWISFVFPSISPPDASEEELCAILRNKGLHCRTLSPLTSIIFKGQKGE